MPKKPVAAQPLPRRVWIEFDKVSAEARPAYIETFNRWLVKLGDDRTLWWDEKDYVYAFGNDYGYMTLPDGGDWFNLDRLAKGQTNGT